MLKTRGAAPWLLAALMLAGGPASADFMLRDGDSPVVFLGDSITRSIGYTTLIQTFVLSRFPSWRVSFRDVGIGGDTSWLARRGGFEAGFRRDVAPLKPAVVTIGFGMNDARGGEATYPKYIEHQTRLIRRLKTMGARVILLTPTPEERYEPSQPAGSFYNRMLAKYIAGLKEVAAREGVALIDQHAPFLELLEKGRKAGILGTKGEPDEFRLTEDDVHPTMAGHIVMADAVLKAMGAPALVSSAGLNAATRALVTSGCRVEWRDAPAGQVSFTRHDDALPWPLPRIPLMLAQKLPGFTPLDDLSRLELKVSGLSAANYILEIDGAEAARLSRRELEAGVNLSGLKSPLAAQASKLYEAVMEKEMLAMRRKDVAYMEIPPELSWLGGAETELKRKKELARLDALVAPLDRMIESLRKPLPHVFLLKPL